MKIIISSVFFLMFLLISCGSDTGSGNGNDSNVTPDETTDESSDDKSDDLSDDLSDEVLTESDETVNDEDSANNSPIVIGHNNTDPSQIPDAAILDAKNNLHIAYQHTSHGSQLITGMDVLKNHSAYDGKYDWNSDGSSGALELHDSAIPDVSDLSTGDTEDENGDTPWVVATRAFLNDEANSDINVVLWSWCSGSDHDVQRYITNMEKLISEFPGVTFPFMTAHSNGDGESTATGAVHMLNQAIREHCAQNNRLLFDFADIEAHNPDGDYFWDQNMSDNLNYDDGNWAVEWIADNPDSELATLTGECSGCAHSDDPVQANLNCVLKGRAAWWMFAVIAGWNGL